MRFDLSITSLTRFSISILSLEMIRVTRLVLTMRDRRWRAIYRAHSQAETRGERGVAHPLQSFFRFCAKVYFLFFFFFQRLIDPPITPISADLKILPGSARVGILFFCDITSTPSPPPLSMPMRRTEKSTVCTCASLVCERTKGR